MFLLFILQILSIVIINVVVLFVTLDIGVYSNWFIAGSMLLAAILMSKATTTIIMHGITVFLSFYQT